MDISELSKWNCIIDSKNNTGGLYIGDIDCAQDTFLLSKLKIGAILSVIDHPEVTIPQHFTHLTIPIPDCQEESLLDHFEQCHFFIDSHRMKTNVMVHCFAGISRSATIVVAYLMKLFHWRLEKSLQIVKTLRKQVKPNEGFLEQLKQYENDLFYIENQALPLKQIEQEIQDRKFKLQHLRAKYNSIKLSN